MICPNCGASNSTRATFCRRCHQRLPVAGLAAGVTYPRRRAASTGASRLPILAALALALAGLVVGALLVSLARPGGGVANASPTGSPVSSLPVFVQTTPTPTAAPSPPPESFPGLPTPGTPSPSVGPTDSGFVTPPPSIGPTPTPTNHPTPTPTKKPTPPPTPTPTPTPTGTPAPVFTCANATGTPTDHVVVGFGNNDKKSKGWCLEQATFHIVPGSQWGKGNLTVNGKTIATFSCDSPPTPCGDDTQQIDPIKLAKPGSVLSWQPTDCRDATSNPCTGDQAFEVTVTVDFEKATTQ